ncbi:MAG: hypothetical protein AAF571_14080 [Verrucomicrobiota bacterium]
MKFPDTPAKLIKSGFYFGLGVAAALIPILIILYVLAPLSKHTPNSTDEAKYPIFSIHIGDHSHDKMIYKYYGGDSIDVILNEHLYFEQSFRFKVKIKEADRDFLNTQIKNLTLENYASKYENNLASGGTWITFQFYNTNKVSKKIMIRYVKVTPLYNLQYALEDSLPLKFRSGLLDMIDIATDPNKVETGKPNPYVIDPEQDRKGNG